MSKRCELQKEYYKEYGNYKGGGKYNNHYVNWLENKVLALTLTSVSKSFAVGKKVKIIGCEKGHRFMTGEIVDLVEKELNMWWAKNNVGDEWLINENEANVC